MLCRPKQAMITDVYFSVLDRDTADLVGRNKTVLVTTNKTVRHLYRSPRPAATPQPHQAVRALDSPWGVLNWLVRRWRPVGNDALSSPFLKKTHDCREYNL